jgi:multisubunit Na+/H+ antiporter MnhF subunit
MWMFWMTTSIALTVYAVFATASLVRVIKGYRAAKRRLG